MTVNTDALIALIAQQPEASRAELMDLLRQAESKECQPAIDLFRHLSADWDGEEVAWLVRQAKAELSYDQEEVVAHEWHSARRAGAIKRHGRALTSLFGDVRSDALSCLTMLLLIGAHAAVALLLPPSWALTVLAAATVGAHSAFGFQALNHDLMHGTSVLAPVRAAVALAGAACTAVPWWSYYFSGAHRRHHLYTGTVNDHDAEALFWCWERVPAALDGSRAGAVLWLSIVAMVVPFVQMYSLLRCVAASPRTNIFELCTCIGETTATVVAHSALSHGARSAPHALAYLLLSMGFANGFLCHPLLGFWLLQHLCVAGAKTGSGGSGEGQPTVSYCGSELWQWLNFNELRHVQHHDFARVPWMRLHKLESVCPEMYGRDLRYCASIRTLIWHWVSAKGGLRMDFACRHALGDFHFHQHVANQKHNQYSYQ